MTRIDWSRIRPLLSRLWELPEEEHEAYLARACEGDERLARSVLRMFAEERDEHRFLEAPVSVGDLDLGGLEPGARLGPYRLLRVIGEGGMGTVWLAERDDRTYEKRVAVKLLKHGLSAGDVLQRFRNERQVLAWLDHPGIARLIDGGRTESGLPYLVMEHVDGSPIDAHCCDRRLSIEERLRLFLSVCDAVQHAHERGVVHRDLKPSNILVDQEGRARLLDFGIAKVLGAESEQELFELTRTGQRLYSPHYASPEQVRGEIVTAASDVYSLGVVLYELLTGRRPYRASSVSQFELERVVCEQEPERPSTSSGTTVLESDVEPWSARGFEAERALKRRLAGDLDWILLACLRKEPERRYASVGALAADLRRHLDCKPIDARPESLGYRASRFTRRHRALVTSVALVLLAGWIALAVSLQLLAKARAAEAARDLESYVAGLQAAEGAIRGNELAQARATLAGAPAELRGWEWRHLSRRLDRSARAWEGPGQERDRMACDPLTGRFAFIGERAGLIDVETGETRTSSFAASPSTSVGGGSAFASFHPRGEGLLATFGDHRTRVLDPASLEVRRVLAYERVRGAEFGPRGDRLALALDSGEAVLLAWPSLAEEERWFTGADRPYYARFSPHGELLAVGGWDETVRLWSLATSPPALERELRGHTMEIHSLAFDPAGERLATASLDQTVRVWSLAEPGRPPLVFREHRSSVEAVVFHPLDGTLVSRDALGEILRWDPDTGEVRSRIRTEGRGALGISADGRWILASEVNSGRGVGQRLWPSNSEDVRSFFACEFANRVAFSPDGSILFCSAPDGSIRRWDRDGRELPKLSVDRVPLWLSATVGNQRIVAIHQDGRLSSWDLGGAFLASIGLAELLQGPRWWSASLWFNPRLDTLESLAASTVQEESGDRVAVIDLEAARPVAVTPYLAARVADVRWQPGGRRLLILTHGGRAYSWAPLEGTEPRELDAQAEGVQQAAFEPSGRELLLVGSLGSIRLVDFQTGDVAELRREGTACMAAAWHPTEPRFAVGYDDGSIGLWDAEQHRELVRLSGHRGAVRSLAFSPEGERLASCGYDGWVRVWDAGE